MPNQKLKYGLVFFLLCLVLRVFTQENITRYGISDGLADLHVKTMYQDSKGYLWVGTWDGLSKFDGHRFVSYKHEPDDTTTIFNDEILQITEDSTGQIWAYTRDGLMKYVEGENNFQRVYLSKLHKEKKNTASSQGLLFDSNGLGWFIADEGLYNFTPDLQSIRCIETGEVTQVKYNCLLADSTGIWIQTSEGLFHFNYQTLEKNILAPADADIVYTFNVDLKAYKPHQILRTSNGQMVVRSANYGIFITNDQTKKLELIVGLSFPGFLHQPYEFMRIREIEPRKLAFGSRSFGLAIYDMDAPGLVHKHPLQKITNNQTIFAILRDNQHNLWLGSMEGLIKYREPQLNFKQWLSGSKIKSGVKGSFLTTIFVDDTHYWFGSRDGGLNRINKLTNTVERINLPAAHQLISNDIRAYNMCPFDSEHLLINFDTSVFLYHRASGRFDHLLNVKGHVYKFYQDNNGLVWCSGGYKVFNIKKENGKVVIVEKENFMGFHRDILIDKNQKVYLAGQAGLRVFDDMHLENGKLYIPPGAQTIPEVVCIHQNHDGLLWLGTLRYGLYLFDPETESFLRHFDESNGLIDNSINVIYEDEQGLLWMSTWKGISCFDPANERLTNYSTVNGLPFPEFNTTSHFQTKDGTLFFGGIGGVISFEPGNFVNFNIKSTTKITAVTSSKGLLDLPFPLADEETIYELPWNENSLRIAFSNFDFRTPAERRYRYRLKNEGKQWILNPPGDVTATLFNLQAGLNHFQVQSACLNHPWNEPAGNLLVKILPQPFYQQQRFQFVVLGILLFFVAAFIIARLRNLNMRKQIKVSALERHSSQMRLNFLKSQMNPHFYFNTLNSINSYILDHDIRSANKFLTRFAQLMREILENSQQDYVSIAEEKKVLENYMALQQLRFPSIFDYEVLVDDSILSFGIPPMLLQPFAENAIEYAFVDMKKKGHVEVCIKRIDDKLLCSVKDNGIGIENSRKMRAGRKRKSAALKNIKNRIEMLNSIDKLNVNLEIGKAFPDKPDFPGTCIKLHLPCIKLKDGSY